MRALRFRVAGLTGCFTFTPTWFLILAHNPSASVTLRNMPHSFPSRNSSSLFSPDNSIRPAPHAKPFFTEFVLTPEPGEVSPGIRSVGGHVRGLRILIWGDI